MDQPYTPPLTTEAELAAFARIQARLQPMFRRVFPDPRVPRCVVILPSLTLDQEVLARISGVHHYEERMLCLLLLLRLPRTRVIYLSSKPIPEAVVDYYLNLLPGVPARHARDRLTLLSCHDGSDRSLTAKLLERPRLIARIRGGDPDPRGRAHDLLQRIQARAQLGAAAWGADLWLRSGAASSGLQERRASAVPGGRRADSRRHGGPRRRAAIGRGAGRTQGQVAKFAARGRQAQRGLFG